MFIKVTAFVGYRKGGECCIINTDHIVHIEQYAPDVCKFYITGEENVRAIQVKGKLEDFEQHLQAKSVNV